MSERVGVLSEAYTRINESDWAKVDEEEDIEPTFGFFILILLASLRSGGWAIKMYEGATVWFPKEWQKRTAYGKLFLAPAAAAFWFVEIVLSLGFSLLGLPAVLLVAAGITIKQNAPPAPSPPPKYKPEYRESDSE